MTELIKNKLLRQENEQYLAIGKFVVQFEILFFAIKNKLSLLCGQSEEVKMLLEPYSLRQTIDFLSNVIELRTKDWNEKNCDKLLYRKLVKDLNELNNKRNLVIHTPWFIGWRSEKDTDITEINGFKFSGVKNFKVKKLTAKEIDKLTDNCKTLYSVFFTIWSIDNILHPLPMFSELWNRNSSGEWIDIRI